MNGRCDGPKYSCWLLERVIRFRKIGHTDPVGSGL